MSVYINDKPHDGLYELSDDPSRAGISTLYVTGDLQEQLADITAELDNLEADAWQVLRHHGYNTLEESFSAKQADPLSMLSFSRKLIMDVKSAREFLPHLTDYRMYAMLKSVFNAARSDAMLQVKNHEKQIVRDSRETNRVKGASISTRAQAVQDYNELYRAEQTKKQQGQEYLKKTAVMEQVAQKFCTSRTNLGRWIKDANN